MMSETESPLMHALYRYNKLANSNIVSLTKDQERVLDILVNNQKDCFVVLPTGSGKSLIFEIAPIYHNVMYGNDCKILIIEPLDSIISHELDKFPGKAVKIDKDFSVTSCSAVTYIFAHPEQVRSNHKLLKTIGHDIRYVCVDEAHLVLDWGDEFRPAFNRLGELSSILPDAKVVAMTATATSKTVTEIAKKLNMVNYDVVIRNPVRDNIYLSVVKRYHCATGIQKSMDQILIPLFDELKDNFSMFPRTILYVTQNYMAYAYQKAKATLGQAFWHGEEEVVAEYHSSHAKEQKRYVELALQSPESSLRLVMATMALGVGADLSLVQQVLHIRPPSNLEAYTQEVGRAGRRGQSSMAVLYYNMADLHNTPDLTSSMRQYCQNMNTCRRTLLAQHFGQMDVEQSAQPSCDVCSGSSPTPPPMPDNRVMELLTMYTAHDPTGTLMAVLTHDVMQKVAISFSEKSLNVERLISFGLSADVAFSVHSFLSAV